MRIEHFISLQDALSNKMGHIEKDPTVAIASDWSTAHGKGADLGYFGKEENVGIADKLKKAFAEWIDFDIVSLWVQSCPALRLYCFSYKKLERSGRQMI